MIDTVVFEHVATVVAVVAVMKNIIQTETIAQTNIFVIDRVAIIETVNEADEVDQIVTIVIIDRAVEIVIMNLIEIEASVPIFVSFVEEGVIELTDVMIGGENLVIKS